MTSSTGSEHVCYEGLDCICIGTDGPSDDCPRHGAPWPPRCWECGRFVRGEDSPVTVQAVGEASRLNAGRGMSKSQLAAAPGLATEIRRLHAEVARRGRILQRACDCKSPDDMELCRVHAACDAVDAEARAALCDCWDNHALADVTADSCGCECHHADEEG